MHVLLLCVYLLEQVARFHLDHAGRENVISVPVEHLELFQVRDGLGRINSRSVEAIIIFFARVLRHDDFGWLG